MLAVQIALGIAGGIILAYVIVRNERDILKTLRSLMQLAGWLLAIGLFGVGLSMAISYGTETFSIGWSDIIDTVVAVAILLLYYIGGLGIFVLYRHFKPKPPDNFATLAGFLFLFVCNVMLVALVSWPLMEFTPFGEWWKGMDAWSRASGQTDSFAVLSNAIGTLWPWLVIWFLRLRKAKTGVSGDVVLETRSDASRESSQGEPGS